MSRRPDRFRTPPPARVDVAIVGAGTGGLLAGALLARRGRSVLLCDQHYVAGGNATVFHRPGYEFDIGLHYIGSCEPDDAIPRMLRAAGVDDVSFNRLDPRGADIFVLPDGERVQVPGDLDAFAELLVARYPEERRGIARFMRLVRQVDRLGRIPNAPWSALHILPRSYLALRYRGATLARVLRDCVRDRELQLLLAGWQIVYALPPSEVSALVHAGAMMHYVSGAYYPRGGGQRISDRLAEAIEAHGGQIALDARVTRIVVEAGRARGIVFENRHLGEREVVADQVICNADIQRTLLELVDAQQLSRKTRERTARYRWPPGIASLYLGVERDLAGADAISSATYAIYPELDVEPCYRATARGDLYEAPYTCLSVPTLKDPDNPRLAPPGVHNMQLMSVAPSDPAAWGVSERELADGSYRHSAAYAERKHQYGERMLAAAERLLPGLRADLVFREMATPLTHRRYIGSSTGSGYGIALTPDQILLRRPPASTEIDGLVLAGASLRTMHGIIGALFSGVEAAAAVTKEPLGREIFGERNGAPRGAPRPRVLAAAR